MDNVMKDNDKIVEAYEKVISEQASSDKKEMTAPMINLRKISDPAVATVDG